MNTNRVIFFLLITSMLFSACSGNKKEVFKLLGADETGIHFNNMITENDSINILDLSYVYNGGGVAIADFNNDSLQDIFFTANMVANKLYLNKSGMKFKDVSAAAKIEGEGKWCTGAVAVDINNDGLMDVYAGASIKSYGNQRANILYINKGINKEGIPVFEDEAEAYGVADTGYTTHAAFFDYDNDGDLDLYVLTDKMGTDRYSNEYRNKIADGSSPTTDRLYRNDCDSSAGHPVFTNVSKEAGILMEGFGLGVNITDINNDGWKDIYVTNDFLTNDLLWINNKNGTFTDRAAEYFKHTSFSAMGNDVTDINNDGLADIIAVDMMPETNYRKKMMLPTNNYQIYVYNNRYNYQYQYGRNTLQLNQGFAKGINDSIAHPVFSEIGYLAGIAETDWSWTPMVTDFDNDGYRDIIITNGFPKDITDRDFISFRQDANEAANKKTVLKQIPEVRLHSFAFHNNGNTTFTDVSADWGLMEPAFSSGAAYGDLDNDGDLDFVVNITNGEARVYENKTGNSKENNKHYLGVQFKGAKNNINGLGASVELHYDNGKMQVYENTPYRGYLSTVQQGAHFGLDTIRTIDSVIIKWPNGNMQLLKNIKTNQVITVDIAGAIIPYSFPASSLTVNSLFTNINDSVSFNYTHKEKDFNDFNIQKLLPHKLSEYGPGLAVGDVDGNGLDDIIVGGAANNNEDILLQQQDGKFITKRLVTLGMNYDKSWEDMGLLLFDADADGDLDLYIGCGGYENELASTSYQDKLMLNDGKGNFSYSNNALPQITTSKSCVRAADYDKDGDLDLFVAGRVAPWNFPKAVSSFIFRNDTKNGVVKFTDVTTGIAPPLINIGMVCDALWTDFDNDGWQDIVLAGEYMPVSFLKNDKGIFKNKSSSTGINNHLGAWNSIAAADYDNDGDIDYIAGNMGINSVYRASEAYPARVVAKDFEKNNSYDAVPFLYLKDRDEKLQEFPAFSRDDLVKQMYGMRSKFENYNSYAVAGLHEIFTNEELKDAQIVQANDFKTSYIKNLGNGKFEITALPLQAQVSAINGIIAEDFDGDGNTDIVMNGNDYSTEVSAGRYDALNGLFMKGDGKGNFIPQSITQSGIYIPGNGKSLVTLKNNNGSCLMAAAQNRGPLLLFRLNKSFKCISLLPDDVNVLITYKNGKKKKQEIYYGASFLSQQARFVMINDGIAGVNVMNAKGISRKLLLQ